MSHLEHLLVLGLGAHVAAGQPEPVLLCPGQVLGLGLPRLHGRVLLLPWAKRGTKTRHTQLTRATAARPRGAERDSLRIYQQAGGFLLYPQSNAPGKLCFCWKTHLDARETFQALH